jgi:hypothetical protein
MNGTTELLKLWLSLSLGSQIVNFVFIIISLVLVFFGIYVLVKTIKLRIKTKKAIISTSPLNKIEQNNKNIKDVNLAEEENVPSLLHHRIFNVISGTQSDSIFNIDSDNFKTAIGLTFLKKCKYFVWEKELKEFVENIENARDEVFNLTKKFVDIEKEYTRLAESTNVTLPNGIILPRVPKIFVEKYEKDNKLFKEEALRNLEAILNSRYYDGWRERAIACLDILCLVFSNDIIIADWSISMLNGELDDEISKMIGANFSTHKY